MCGSLPAWQSLWCEEALCKELQNLCNVKALCSVAACSPTCCITISTHFTLGSPSVATGPGLLTVGVETHDHQQCEFNTFIILPLWRLPAPTLYGPWARLGRLQTRQVASWILLSVMQDAAKPKGSTLYWMLVSDSDSGQVNWLEGSRGRWCVEGLPLSI